MSAAVTDDAVAAAVAGDPTALRALYDALAPVVLGYLTAKGVSDAEAVTSDVFLAVFRRLPELTGGAKGLRTFVMSVAHARMVDDVRARERRPREAEYVAGEDVRVAPSAETLALDSIADRAVLDLLARLPADQRDVLALRVIADLPLEEVATIMQRSVGSVKQLQRRGLLALRRLVSEEGVTLR